MQEEDISGFKEITPELSQLKKSFTQKLENVSGYVESLVENPEEPMGIEVLLEAVGKEEPFVDLKSEEQAVLLRAIREQLGVDFSKMPVRTYTWEGLKGTPGEGEAKISVFSTNQEGLGLHKIEYADGKISYAFGLLENPLA